MALTPVAPSSFRPGRKNRLQTNRCSSSSSNRSSGTSSSGRVCACSWLHWRALAVACAVQLLAVVDDVAASGDHLKAGDAAVSSGQYSAAVRHYSEFIKADPSAALGYTKRAAVYLQQRKFRDAERDLDAAVQAEPTSVQPLLNRGRLLRQLCRFDSALNDFNAILAIKPGHATTTKEVATTTAAKAALARARTLLEQGKGEEANRELDAHVLTAAPDCVEARAAKAQAMLARGDYDGVVAETSKILKVNENDMQGLLLRAKAYMYLGDHDVAMKHHQAALRYDPDHDEHKKEYRKLKNLEKKTKEANEQLEKKKYRSAVEQFKAAMEMMPEHKKHAVKLQMGLCKAYVKLTRGKEAAEACTIVLDAEPDNYDARMQRGEARLMLEEWEAAMQDFKHAMQINQSQEAMMGHQRAEKGLKMSKRKDFYKILEVEKTATAAEIKRSYKKLALKWHPDKNTENKEEAEAKFRDIAAAYEVLGDEEKRGRFDRGEDVDQPEGQGGAGFNPFGQQFHFQAGGGFPGGGFPGGFQFGGGFPGGFHFGGFGG